MSKILMHSMVRMTSAMIITIFMRGSTMRQKRCHAFAPKSVAAFI